MGWGDTLGRAQHRMHSDASQFSNASQFSLFSHAFRCIPVLPVAIVTNDPTSGVAL